jgi:hypothetical protein
MCSRFPPICSHLQLRRPKHVSWARAVNAIDKNRQWTRDKEVTLCLDVCPCSFLFASARAACSPPHVCNSEQTRVFEQIRVIWHESGRSLADAGHPRNGQGQELAHSFCISHGFEYLGGSQLPGKRCETCRDHPHSGHILSAVLDRICRLVSSDSGRARKSSRFFLISGTPGPGQSVPNRVLPATSSNRGKY